ncbi:MAG: hypothetical protein ACREK6_18610 [Candidatus Rokuibacteriota bacterium]
MTASGWLLIIYGILMFTTPVNPLIAHPYLPILWYVGLGICGLWLLARITREETGQ